MFSIAALMIHVKHANQNITLDYMSLGSSSENNDKQIQKYQFSLCV